MKLLIVDDEELTRKGVLATIDWNSLNIGSVIQAENGLQGLELAKKEKPDIIISDIRMPRMNGVQMAEQIAECSPDTSIIFISGYSDREYLKAAIKLKAVSYVEKPIDVKELKDAVLAAIDLVEQRNRSKRSEAVHALAASGKLALSMTYPPDKRNSMREDDLSALPFTLKATTTITTIIIKIISSVDDLDTKYINHFHRELAKYLKIRQLFEVHVTKYDQYFIYQIFSETAPSTRIILQLGEFMKSQLTPLVPYFIAIGETVIGIENSYSSYTQAVVLLQSSFFYDYNSILYQPEETKMFSPVLSISVSAYSEVLHSRNLERIMALEEKIYDSFKHSHTLLPNQVKDFYYKLFTAIQNAYKELSVNHSDEFSDSETVLEYVQNCHTLRELHNRLSEKSRAFYHDVQERPPENPIVLAIKNFVTQNYQNENLSVKDISLHVHMSSTYVCTLFKNETNITLNQFISNYRVEKAKQLLADSNYKILDISSKVGYSDGNYFGKSFKKHVGLSPSEYREKILE